jgi:hypothetical protein
MTACNASKETAPATFLPFTKKVGARDTPNPLPRFSPRVVDALICEAGVEFIALQAVNFTTL